MELHPCAVGGCPRRIPGHKLMCSRHWTMVPKRTRDLVHAAWRRYDLGILSLGTLRAAQQRAIDAVEAQVA
jgi:hypothetical protein